MRLYARKALEDYVQAIDRDGIVHQMLVYLQSGTDAHKMAEMFQEEIDAIASYCSVTHKRFKVEWVKADSPGRVEKEAAFEAQNVHIMLNFGIYSRSYDNSMINTIVHLGHMDATSTNMHRQRMGRGQRTYNLEQIKQFYEKHPEDFEQQKQALQVFKDSPEKQFTYLLQIIMICTRTIAQSRLTYVYHIL